MIMTLDIPQRLALLGLMPQKGNILTVRTKVEFTEAISFSSEETEEMNLRRLPDGRVQWNRDTILFTVPTEDHQADLEEGFVSDSLDQEFKSNDIVLSDEAILSTTPGGNWLITDGETNYPLRREEGNLRISKEIGGTKEFEISAGASGMIKDALREQEKAGTLPASETTLDLWKKFMETGPLLVEEPAEPEPGEEAAKEAEPADRS